MAKPILILQMQRMGDLILSFPLFSWLSRIYPQRTIHVIAEQKFYQGLVDLSPRVLYIPWESHGHALKHKYDMVINLSHRKEAAWLAGKVKARQIVGPYRDESDNLRIQGQWQLYRSSIVQNNRYNRFHWAELNALDVIDCKVLGKTVWQKPGGASGTRKIGLFVGASQENKRPGPYFYALLAKELIRRNYQPILIGGPGDKKQARDIVKLSPVKLLNLTGKLSLSQLASVFSTLELLITPDTGPMHLSAWCGLKTLNLSLGPVNPWETGPYQPGHAIIRSSISCTGCWECIQKDLLCADSFKIRQVILIMEKMMHGSLEDAELTGFKAVNIFKTSRSKGLYNLNPCRLKQTVSFYLGEFWQSYWLYSASLGSKSQVREKVSLMVTHYPFVHDKLLKCTLLFLAQLKKLIQKGQIPDHSFWRQSPPYFRPFAGFVHIMWQNQDYSPSSLAASTRMLETLLGFLETR